MGRPVWDDLGAASYTKQFCLAKADAVLDALGLEQVGWCDDAEWTDVTKTVGRIWHQSKPQMGGVPVYRIKETTDE